MKVCFEYFRIESVTKVLTISDLSEEEMLKIAIAMSLQEEDLEDDEEDLLQKETSPQQEKENLLDFDLDWHDWENCEFLLTDLEKTVLNKEFFRSGKACKPDIICY